MQQEAKHNWHSEEMVNECFPNFHHQMEETIVLSWKNTTCLFWQAKIDKHECREIEAMYIVVILLYSCLPIFVWWRVMLLFFIQNNCELPTKQEHQPYYYWFFFFTIKKNCANIYWQAFIFSKVTTCNIGKCFIIYQWFFFPPPLPPTNTHTI